MNSKLYNKTWDFPEDLRVHLKLCFNKVKNADSNVEGYNRNKRLQTAKNISYPELKRIKNFFDNFQGRPQDAPFILNGENKMKEFVNGVLSGARNSLSTSAVNRDNTGMMTKNDMKAPKAPNNMNYSSWDDKKGTIEKYDLQVTEALKKINSLMKKIL